MKSSVLFFCVILLAFACKQENSYNQILGDNANRVSKNFPVFPEGTSFKELVVNNEKAVEVQLPNGYFFRVDGEVLEGSISFTCVCQGGNGGCYPILIGNPKKQLEPGCMSTSACSGTCKPVIVDRKEAVWDIEIGYASLIKSLEIEANKSMSVLEKNKKVKPLFSFIRFTSLPSASSEDFNDPQVKAEIQSLKEKFFTHTFTGEKLASPKIDINAKALPEGFAVLPLEVSGKVFFMLVPQNNGLVDITYRTLPVYDFPGLPKCTGGCGGQKCSMQTVHLSGDTYLYTCAGCPSNCVMTY